MKIKIINNEQFVDLLAVGMTIVAEDEIMTMRYIITEITPDGRVFGKVQTYQNAYLDNHYHLCSDLMHKHEIRLQDGLQYVIEDVVYVTKETYRRLYEPQDCISEVLRDFLASAEKDELPFH